MFHSCENLETIVVIDDWNKGSDNGGCTIKNGEDMFYECGKLKSHYGCSVPIEDLDESGAVTIGKDRAMVDYLDLFVYAYFTGKSQK